MKFSAKVQKLIKTMPLQLVDVDDNLKPVYGTYNVVECVNSGLFTITSETGDFLEGYDVPESLYQWAEKVGGEFQCRYNGTFDFYLD